MPRRSEHLAHRRDRADAHDARVDARDGAADERAERLDAELARLLLRRDHERRRAVVDARRVAGRDRAALAERRLQRGELLERRVGTRMLVARHVADRDELVVEAARLVGGRPAPLRLERERVLILARDAPALGDVLARLAHRLRREQLGELRIREAPAERRVVERPVAAANGFVAFARDERRAASSTPRRPRRTGRRRPRSRRGTRRRRPRGRTRRAG